MFILIVNLWDHKIHLECNISVPNLMLIYQIAVISLKTTNVKVAQQEKSGSQPNQAY